jgi:hypothetical protein
MDIPAPAQVSNCAGFRPPASTIYPRAVTAGGRKAPRHEIASGGNAAAVPQESGAAKRLWGFGHEAGPAAICVRYPAQTGMQLKRSGTNVAKWGFHVLSHLRFQRLKWSTAAGATTLRDELHDEHWPTA